MSDFSLAVEAERLWTLECGLHKGEDESECNDYLWRHEMISTKQMVIEAGTNHKGCL